MLTRRGSILLTTAFVLAVISLSIGQIYTSLIALSVIGWLSTSWLIFIFRACALPHRIRMERRIDGKPMERNTGILGRNTQVKVLVQVRKLNIRMFGSSIFYRTWLTLRARLRCRVRSLQTRR